MTFMPNSIHANGRVGAHTEGGAIVGAVRRLFGSHAPDAANKVGFEQVGAFLTQHHLSPTPQNYDVAYRYLIEGDHQIVDAVDELRSSRAGICDQGFAEIAARGKGSVNAEMLSKFVSRAQSYVHQTAKIIDESHSSVKTFGDNLETIELPQDLANQILGLTKAMMAKSRRVEFKLKKMDSEIGELRMRLDDARKDAMLDPLTGLPNRRAFLERLGAAMARVEEGERTVCVAYCDIDHFKAVNDTYGHEVGDRVIQFIAKRIQDSATDMMSVARFGGEEFVVLFEDSTLDEAIDHMNAVRVDIGERRLVCRDSGEPLGKVSFSAGIAAMQGGIDGSSLLKAADQALYRAKELGRDRIETPLSQSR